MKNDARPCKCRPEQTSVRLLIILPVGADFGGIAAAAAAAAVAGDFDAADIAAAGLDYSGSVAAAGGCSNC